MKQLKLVAILVSLLISGLILANGSRSSQPTYQIELDAAPLTAEIFIDDKKVKPGLHTISKDVVVYGRKEGFAEFKKDIRLETLSPDSATFVGIVLEPSTDGTKNWYRDHDKDEQKSSEISSRIFDTRSQSVEQKYPFISRLPTGGRTFEIAYGRTRTTDLTKNPNSLAIYISAARPEDRTLALKYLYNELGVAPESIEVILEEAVNPFIIDRTPDHE